MERRRCDGCIRFRDDWYGNSGGVLRGENAIWADQFDGSAALPARTFRNLSSEESWQQTVGRNSRAPVPSLICAQSSANGSFRVQFVLENSTISLQPFRGPETQRVVWGATAAAYHPARAQLAGGCDSMAASSGGSSSAGSL